MPSEAGFEASDGITVILAGRGLLVPTSQTRLIWSLPEAYSEKNF
ncbi:TPA: hypothetical protein ACFRG8_001487 [Neisseria lactamica]|nr:hypothetical protein [Neisseria lactamica]